MTLVDLYEQINNPLDDPKIIIKLLNAYAKMSGMGGYYGQLVKTVQKQYRGQYYFQDADRFYALLFNKWKNSITAMSRSEFAELYSKGSYGKDFIKLRNYLKRIPDVKTHEEANRILYGRKNDKELQDALYRYSWENFGSGTSWTHVCSTLLTAFKDPYPNVEHRLYIDTESIDTFKLMTYFVEKCDAHQQPFYFKFDPVGDRDDSLVVYCSTEDVGKFVDIFREIQREHPDLVSRAKEPPVLTGVIDGWIGYGSEPLRTPDGKNHSFNEIRSNLLEKTLDTFTKKWTLKNRYQQVSFRGQNMLFQECIAMKAADDMIAGLKNTYMVKKEHYERVAKYNNEAPGSIDQNLMNELGYTLEDIHSLQFKQSVYQIILKYIDGMLTKVCNDQMAESIKMQVRNNQTIAYTMYDLLKTLRSFPVNIAKTSPEFIRDVQSTIKASAREYGVDSEKFCFDTHVVAKVKGMKAQQEVQKPQTVYSTSNNSQSIVNENKSLNRDNYLVGAEEFLKLINPSLLEKQMRLPNGTTIPARKYLKDIVFPYLPENGIIILSNGNIMPAIQFVEEYVMFECQESYLGDFAKYMAYKTRKNVGLVRLELSNGTTMIRPKDITNYISPELLGTLIKMPNGLTVSFRQYIRDVFAPYIPADGYVMLNNGYIISVIQYIQDFLLKEAQRGDVSKILYFSTRGNRGRINLDPDRIRNTIDDMRMKADLLNNQGAGLKQS